MSECKNILVTGATGVVGKYLVPALLQMHHKKVQIFAATRNIKKTQQEFSAYPQLQYREFDITKKSTFAPAFKGIDAVFLIRPPDITRTRKHFPSLMEFIKKAGIRDVLFISVYGAEKNRLVPHYQVEQLVKKSELNYVIFRPSFFMQNLTTGFLKDIQQNQQIVSTAGNAVFNWVDANDVAKAASNVLMNFPSFKNQEFDLLGTENYNLDDVAKIISNTINRKITYKKISILAFILHKIRQGMEPKRAFMMALLHFASRFLNHPFKNSELINLLKEEPTVTNKFLSVHSYLFKNSDIK